MVGSLVLLLAQCAQPDRDVTVQNVAHIDCIWVGRGVVFAFCVAAAFPEMNWQGQHELSRSSRVLQAIFVSPGQRCTTTGRAIPIAGWFRWSSHEFISWLLSRTTSYRAGVVTSRGFEDSIRTTIV